jgi:hypothetical protein
MMARYGPDADTQRPQRTPSAISPMLVGSQSYGRRFAS